MQKEINQHKTQQEAYNQKVAKFEKEIPDLNRQIEDKNQIIANYLKTINENALKEGQYLQQIQTMNSKINELQQEYKHENKPLNKNESEKLSNENAELKKTIQTLSQRLQEQQSILSASQVPSLKSVPANEDASYKKKYEDLSKKYQQTSFEFEHLKDQTLTDKDQIEELSLANQALEEQLFSTKWKLGKIVNIGFENADAQLLEKIEQILVSQGENNNISIGEVNNDLSF